MAGSNRFAWMVESAAMSFDEDVDVASALSGDASSMSAIKAFLNDDASPAVLFLANEESEPGAAPAVVAHAGLPSQRNSGAGLVVNKSKLVYFIRSSHKSGPVDTNVAQDPHVLFGELAPGDVCSGVSVMLKHSIAPVVASMSVQGRASMSHVQDFSKALHRFSHELVRADVFSFSDDRYCQLNA